MPLIPALRSQRQADLSEFEASLVYKVSSGTARAITRETLFWKTNQPNKTTTTKKAQKGRMESKLQENTDAFVLNTVADSVIFWYWLDFMYLLLVIFCQQEDSISYHSLCAPLCSF